MTWDEVVAMMRKRWDTSIEVALQNTRFTLEGCVTPEEVERAVADLRAYMERMRDEELTAKH